MFTLAWVVIAVCPATSLRLDEASASASADEAAIFKRDWEPRLQEVAECLKVERYACAVVQGQFDELKFDKKMTGVFGGVSAIQATRARSRSDKVVAWLHQQGVRAEQVRTTPPPTWATYRGVQLSVELACLPKPTTTAEEVTRIIQENPQLMSASQPVVQVTVASPTDGAATRNWLFIEAGIDVPLTFLQPNIYTSPGLRLALGWKNEFLLVKAGGQLGVGSVVEQRLTGGAALSVQYRILDWLAAGLGGRFATGAPSPTAPWLEQYFGLGIEAEQCPFVVASGTRVCFTEAFFPLGTRVRRGEVLDGGIVRINQTGSYQLRAEVGAQVRKDFW